ncbi:unnamed protein product, partial [Amoebophrya sp. A25]
VHKKKRPAANDPHRKTYDHRHREAVKAAKDNRQRAKETLDAKRAVLADRTAAANSVALTALFSTRPEESQFDFLYGPPLFFNHERGAYVGPP